MSSSKVAIVGWFTVAPEKRELVVQQHKALVRQARSQEDCIDFAITADPADPARINNLELWRSESALEHWRKIAKPPKETTATLDVDMKKYFINQTKEPFD